MRSIGYHTGLPCRHPGFKSRRGLLNFGCYNTLKYVILLVWYINDITTFFSRLAPESIAQWQDIKLVSQRSRDQIPEISTLRYKVGNWQLKYRNSSTVRPVVDVTKWGDYSTFDIPTVTEYLSEQLNFGKMY